MDATDDNDELAYVCELRFGRFAAILLPVLVAMACTLATGIYHPTRADKLWPLLSRRALPEQSKPMDDSTVISLTRTTCFGSCPRYSIRIFGSGRVEYVGEKYVCAFGAHAAEADRRDVRRLVEAMIGTGFFGYTWKEGPFWTDAPSANSSLQHSGRSYALHHYHGDEGAPRWLRAMEDEIDRVAGTARWLPASATQASGWRSLCPDSAGGTREVTMSEPIEARLLLMFQPTMEPPTVSYAEPTDL